MIIDFFNKIPSDKINFNQRNVNEQILLFAEQFNGEDFSVSYNLEEIRADFSYGEYEESSRYGLAYSLDLEEVLERLGYILTIEKDFGHYIKFKLRSNDQKEVLIGVGYVIPDRFDDENTPERFIDFNTFKRKD